MIENIMIFVAGVVCGVVGLVTIALISTGKK